MMIHTLLLGAVAVTVATFETAKRKPEYFGGFGRGNGGEHEQGDALIHPCEPTVSSRLGATRLIYTGTAILNGEGWGPAPHHHLKGI